MSALRGWRVLVPRGGRWGSDLAERLSAVGAAPAIAPLIAFEAPDDESALDGAISRLAEGAYDWLVLTSATTVEALARAGATVPAGTRVAVVGGHTAAAAREAGYRVDFLPAGDHSARGLVAQWPDPSTRFARSGTDRGEPSPERADPVMPLPERAGPVMPLPERAERVEGGPRVLLPQSQLADETLLEGLSALGLEVDRVTAYRTVAVAPDASLADEVARGGFDAIVITAGSVASRVADEFPELPATTRLVAIGPRTAAEAEAAGLPIAAVAHGRSGAAIIEALIELAGRGA